MSVQSCLNLLLEVKPSSKRVGPLAVVGLINESLGSAKWKVHPTITYQVFFLSILSIFMEGHMLDIKIYKYI